MSFLDPTYLVDAIAASSQNLFGRYENRFGEYGLLKMMETQNIVDAAEIERIKMSKGRPMFIPVLKKQDLQVSSTLVCDPDGVLARSELVPVEWATASFSIKMIPEQAADNYITNPSVFQNMLTNGLRSTYNVLETAFLANINASRVQGSFPHLYWDSTANEFQIPAAERSRVYDYMRTGMQLFDYSGAMQVISDTGSLTWRSFITRQGAANAENMQPSLDNMFLYNTNRLALNVGELESHYVMPKDSVALITWDSAGMKASLGADRITEADFWYSLPDPFFRNLIWSVHKTRKCTTDWGDYIQNGLPVANRNSGTPTVVDVWEFALEYAYISPYFSGAPADSNIVKFIVQ